MALGVDPTGADLVHGRPRGRPALAVGHAAGVARPGSALVVSFHPELTDDRRLHRLFVEMLASR